MSNQRRVLEPDQLPVEEAPGALSALPLEGTLDPSLEAPPSERLGLRLGWVFSLGLGVLILGVWQASGSFLNSIAVSTPTAILRSIPATFLHGPYGSLIGALGVTMLDLLYGFGISLVVGVAGGLLIGNSRVLGRFFDPIVALGNSSPTIALLPLMIIWLGFGRSSRVLFISIVSVWTIIINTSIGARIARERYKDLIPAFRVSRKEFLVNIVAPGALPYILTGLRVALAHALIAAIISGQEIGESGIGGLANQYGSQFDTAGLFGVIVLTTLVALVLYRGMEMIRSRTCQWVNASS